MTFEDFENIVSLLSTIIGLLLCVFRYIETPRRGYRYLIAFFLANFLSEYYWTVYQLVMHSYPNVSVFTAYLGWNVGYLMLLLAACHMRREEAKWFFHPIILLPVLFTVPQFVLYIRYGGIWNNLWEVGITTITMVFCLQEIVYYLKNNNKHIPMFSLLVLAYLVAQYGMWTASCFAWDSELSNPYLYCSVLSAVLCVFFAHGAKKHYEVGDLLTKTRSASELRFQVLVQAIVSFVIIVICAVGFFTAFGMKKSLSDGTGFFRDERQLILYLFALSAVLILLVLTLLYLLTTHYRHTLENIRKMSEGKRSRLSFIITIAVTLALMVFAVIYNNVVLYDASVVSVYEDAGEENKRTATELENYLTKAVTMLRVAADSVDLMEKNGGSIQEITRFLMDQTKRQSEQFDENFTGLYAYIDGEYLDGLGWEAPDGYEPTSRDWYKAAVEADGEVVIVSPYVDAQTGSVVITVGKMISESRKANAAAQNVVCLDVIVDHIQEVAKAVEVAGKGYGMVINTDGFIIAHREEAYNGESIKDVYGPELLQGIQETESGRFNAKINDEECTVFVSPVMGQWYSVIVIGNTQLLEDTWSQLAVNIMVMLITFCLITFFYFIGYKNEQIYGRRVEEMNIQVVTALAAAIDAKDNYTRGHSSRVSRYSIMIAEALGWPRQRVENLRFAALLHDIGKIGVPDSILNNPRRLTDAEFEIIKTHTTIGAEILRDRIVIGSAEDVARGHHERYDGKGYPRGLKGPQVCEEARIVAIADAFDAMSSNRVYRKACNSAHIREELLKGRGKQFDPLFTDTFIDLWDRGLLDDIIGEKPLETEEKEETPSVLLQSVLDSFIAQDSSDNVDAVTGLLNRSAGEAAIVRTMKEMDGCFVFIDVDNLKKINDIYGHKAGDKALRMLGETLKAHGESGISCRLGGDELLLFLKGASSENAEKEIRAIFREFAKKKDSDPETAGASLSAGLTMSTPSDSYMNVFNQADKALYHVKQNGKNDLGFYNAASESYREEELDMDRLIQSIRNSGNYVGAMDVEYRQFALLYEYIENLEKRYSQSFKLIMVKLEPLPGTIPHPEELEVSMYFMEQAIRYTVRGVDVVTRYSRQQFLIILLGTDEEGVRTAMSRIIRGYYKMNGSNAFSPSYTVADPAENG